MASSSQSSTYASPPDISSDMVPNKNTLLYQTLKRIDNNNYLEKIDKLLVENDDSFDDQYTSPKKEFKTQPIYTNKLDLLNRNRCK